MFILLLGAKMGRKSILDVDRLLAEVGAEVVETGSFTIQKLTTATGVSTGSIYHRFSSREGLLAEVWIDALRSFQTHFQTALGGEGLQAIEDAALVTPRFCRSHPYSARVLACCRSTEFIGAGSPKTALAEIQKLNDAGEVALRRFARKIERPLLACRLALVAYPLAAVRLYLPKTPVPVHIDAEIMKAARATLEVD